MQFLSFTIIGLWLSQSALARPNIVQGKHHLSITPTCPTTEPIILECGEGIETTQQCSSFCSCGSSGLECPESADCSKESIDYMCGEYAQCSCPKTVSLHTASQLTLNKPHRTSGHAICPSMTPLYLECGQGIDTTDDCATFCSCGPDGFTCPDSSDCGKEAIEYTCVEYAQCSCSTSSIESEKPVRVLNQPTCPKTEAITLECGSGIDSTDQCSSFCSCTPHGLDCPETSDCSKESIDFMCADYAGCSCSK